MTKLSTLLFTALLAISSTSFAEDISGKASDFTLKSRSGENVRLAELSGDVILLNFWASWCGPCRQEMPALQKLQDKYEDLGFTVLGVNVEEDASGADAYLKDVPVSFPILFDPDNTVTKAYDVKAMPTTVIIDRDGNMRYLHLAYKPGYEDKYAEQIKTLLRE